MFTVSTYVISSLCKPDFGTAAQGAKSSPVKNLEPPKSGVIVKVVRNAQKRVVPEEPRNFTVQTKVGHQWVMTLVRVWLEVLDAHRQQFQ